MVPSESLKNLNKFGASQAVSEICLIKKSFDMDRSFVECDSGYSLTLNSSKDFEVTKFAEIYHYNILKQAKGRNGFYIISR